VSNPTVVSVEVIDTHIATLDGERAGFEKTVAAMKITNETEAKQVAQLVAEIASRHKQAEDLRKELVGPLNAHVKLINDKFKPVVRALLNVKQQLSTKLGQFQREQRQKAQAEAQRRKRELEDAERKRREAEQAEQEAGDEAAVAQEHEDRRQSILAKLKQQTAREDKRKAEQSAAAALAKPMPTERAHDWSGGAVKSRRVWKVEVVDVTKMPHTYEVKHTGGSGQTRYHLLQPNPGMVQALMRELTRNAQDDVEEITSVPGLRIYREEEIVT